MAMTHDDRHFLANLLIAIADCFVHLATVRDTSLILSGDEMAGKRLLRVRAAESQLKRIKHGASDH